MRRRRFLQTALAGAAGWMLGTRSSRAAGAEKLPPIRTVTRGPKHHWFGYYDKLQFDPSSRYLLGMEVDFEHRSPRPDDEARIGMVDLSHGDRWIELGKSTAWGWQQGCMLQWIPGSRSEVLWNDRADDHFICRVLDVKTGAERTLPAPIYALGPDGRTAITADFRRIDDLRPGYGYEGVPDPHADELRPSASGVWRVDLHTGEQKLIVSIADAARFGAATPDMKDAKHYFNHLLFNTDGSRIVFLHRWRPDRGRGNFRTRMLTANLDGGDLYVLDPSGNTSHFIWRDPQHILAWTKPEGKPAGFWLFRDRSREIKRIGEGVMTVNGHNTYLPGNRWILNDTYPDRARRQHPYLYHVATGRKVPLGHFYSPPEYRGEWRCDTHPRSSPDGRLVCIDSPHTGAGRQMHVINVSAIVEAS